MALVDHNTDLNCFLSLGYDKLELPFPESGLVEVAMDFDSIQVLY